MQTQIAPSTTRRGLKSNLLARVNRILSKSGKGLIMTEEVKFKYRFTVTKSGRKKAFVFDEVNAVWRVCGYVMAERMVAEGKGVNCGDDHD